MDHARRQAAIEAHLEKLRLDALLVTHLPNIRYLCGFTGSSGALLIHGGRSLFFTDGRYTAQAGAEVSRARVVTVKGSPQLAAAQSAQRHRLRVLGIEGHHMTVSARTMLHRALGPKTRLRDSGPLVEKLRMVKDSDEIALIREAVNLGASLLDTAVRAIRPGVQEMEVAAELEYAARRAGVEAMSFETIVAAGPRSAMPHGVASSAAIPAHGFVVLDFGVILHGYCSDMTRTVHVGKVSAAERRMYQAVREAQQAGMDAVRAGVACGEVDRAARNVLRRAGLARYFMHSTGHGVGLEIHEAPRFARGVAETLHAGMVVTIEPGVYLPARAGVRIEDMMVITQSGGDVLTPAPKELIEL
ncbi:MAG: Xaa-Pro peptidase family protein [Acidobacteriia bacterium]|nr:Xaa-Pro peptidase family protein [Terriglobia bacterium]